MNIQLLLLSVFLILGWQQPSQAVGIESSALPLHAPIPQDNPQTPAKIQLGKQLFFDPRLSKNGLTSCATCHNVVSGSGENNLSFSIKPDGKRSRHTVPSVWNAAFLTTLFWGGGAKSLEEQAEGPLEEMGLGDLEVIAQNVKAIPGYVLQFESVFAAKDSVTLANITKAIASYERTLITPNSAFDRAVRGEVLLGNQARRGYRLFQSIGCASCHSGPAFAGLALNEKTVGVGNFQKFPIFPDNDYVNKYHLAEDLGRYNATQDPKDKNVWRVAPLRNIALTAPYFHNGSVPTLREAVLVMAKTQLNRDLSEGDVKALTEFLRSLSAPLPYQEIPQLPN